MDKTQELKIFDYHGISDIGTVREKNEDDFGHFSNINGELFITCDGIGGYSGGEIASKTAVDSFRIFFENEWKDDLKIAMIKAFEFAHIQVKANMKLHNFHSGTTACVLLIRENKLYYAHIGDSVIYYKAGKKIFKLTKDHSYIQQLLDSKKITKKQAKNHPNRNKITKALGIGDKAEPDLYTKEISPADNDYVLLCTDGLSNFVSKKKISIILERKISIKLKVEKLIDTAENNNSNDNITAQLIMFYNTNNSNTNDNKLNKNLNKRKNNKILSIIGLLILTFLGMWYIFGNKNVAVVNVNISYHNSKLSSFLIKNKKDTLISIYIKKSKHIKQELKRYNISDTLLAHAVEDFTGTVYLKFNILVQDIIIAKPGAEISNIAAFYKINVTDIIKVNNKSELYIKAGEKLIIPLQ